MSEKKAPIPIKNLFYMLCYAWNVLAITDDIKVGSDDYDDAYNLLSRVFSYGIGKLIRSGFHRSYIEQTDELATLRGKILVKESVSQLSMQRKKLVCSYDEYSVNDIFNQVLTYTIDSLVKSPNVSSDTKKELKKQKAFFAGIEAKAPTKENRQKLIFNRNNITYKLLINIAIMLYDNTVVNEDDGKNVFKDFYRHEQMQKVYELFILNFYAIHLDRKKYHVYAPKFQWETNEVADAWDEEDQADDLMPELRTDIVIENKEKNIQFIIDAKYYQNILVSSYQSEVSKFRRDHISQVYTYMDNSPFSGEKRGALMYPTVTYDVYETRKFKPGRIFFKSLNLNREWQEIENDLIEFASRAD